MMKTEEFLKKFYLIEAKIFFIKLWIKKHNYIADIENDKELKNKIKNKNKLAEKYNKLLEKIILENVELIKKIDFEKEYKNPKYRIDYEEQRKISKKLFNEEYTIEDLL